MYRGKKFLAIIPARSGSKGLKNKNIKLLNGKHLIGYTIEAAKDSNIFDYILVSTDSSIYAEVAKIYGANVPFLRSKEFSEDNSTTESVILSTISKLKSMDMIYDYFVLLQPTSPLRTAEDIINSVNLLLDNDLNSVVSVCEMEHSIKICNKIPEDLSMNNFLSKSDNKRRQEMEKYYRINGAIYISNINEYLESRNFYNEKSKAYIMKSINSIDIDSDLDFIIAKSIM
ncbi:acylneuraminate cytidylyltransferase family protein [Clostridium perfringens]|nr:acylneuraminate cytidylyltransferase family protein [Clostridium perfringens]ELC8426488.1 acylneuraminate cytidylyltransferase family protein [Clostridium perfringens]